MQEKWYHWKPENKLIGKYYIDSITVNVEDKFKMILSDSDNNNKILISFPHGVYAFRSTDESFTLLTVDFLEKNYGTDFYSSWTFFKVENSKYLKWISLQSFGDISQLKFMHFCILAGNTMVDIIATYEPTVTFLD